MAEKHKWTSEEVMQWYKEKQSSIYCNPADSNWVVRKTNGLGWTMNLANPYTGYFLAAVLVIAWLVSILR